MLLCAVALVAVGCGADAGTATSSSSPPGTTTSSAGPGTTTTATTLAATTTTVATTITERDARWFEDLEFLVTELESGHVEPFHSVTREEFEAEAAALAGAVPELSDTEIAFEIQRVVALIGDGHTAAQPDLAVTAYPIAVESFADGVVVVGTSSDHEDLLGASLVGVHGVPTADVIQAGLPYFAGDSEQGKRPEVARQVIVPEFLDVILDGNAPAPGTLTLSRDGREADITLPAMPLDTWRTAVTIPQDRAVPLAAQRPHAYYWYRYLPEHSTLFVQYNVCADAPDLSFADFTDSAFETIAAEHPDRLVIDLRLNRGGDSTVFRTFLDRLREHPLGDDGNLYVLIGSRTFSSALINALELRAETGAILVGQPTSGSPNHYGEVATFVLPNSGIVVGYATRFFRLTESDAEALIPDVLVERTSTDHLAGIDATLERALEGAGGT
jgi:hypothetical protein